jgi:hypothetical protein
VKEVVVIINMCHIAINADRIGRLGRGIRSLFNVRGVRGLTGASRRSVGRRMGKMDSKEVVGVEPVRKMNRHVVIALNHMKVRRETLIEKRSALNEEIEELDAAILALE